MNQPLFSDAAPTTQPIDVTTQQRSTDLEAAKALLAQHEPVEQTPKQFADAITAPPSDGLDLDALIAAARAEAGLKPAEIAKDALEVPSADFANQLLARASELKRIIDASTKERDTIGKFFAELIETAEAETGKEIGELTVHGAPVFTYKRSVSRVLNQSHIKSLFPDIPENAEMYVDSERRARIYK